MVDGEEAMPDWERPRAPSGDRPKRKWQHVEAGTSPHSFPRHPLCKASPWTLDATISIPIAV